MAGWPPRRAAVGGGVTWDAHGTTADSLFRRGFALLTGSCSTASCGDANCDHAYSRKFCFRCFLSGRQNSDLLAILNTPAGSIS